MIRGYGISLKRFREIVARAGGNCEMCQVPFGDQDGWGPSKLSPRIDHDHETGEVRGLLCLRCNVALGHYESVRESAAAYLAQWRR